MAFFSAALGQAALTGVAIGLLLGEPLNAPYGGMFGFCLLATLGMVFVKRHATLPPDTLIGVFLALTLGLGLCLLVVVTRQFNVHQVESVLFGSLLTVTDADLGLLLVAGVGIGFVLLRTYNDLLLDSLSPPIAKARGVNSPYLEYLENDLAPRAKASSRLGRANFEQKVKLDEGLPLSADRLLAIAERELQHVVFRARGEEVFIELDPVESAEDFPVPVEHEAGDEGDEAAGDIDAAHLYHR